MKTIFPKDFYACGIHCGIKKNGKKDLSLFFSSAPCVSAAMFTKNIFQAAPIKVSRSHVKNNISAIIANSGCANACTGERGMKDAEQMCGITAANLGLKTGNILVASTGVIGGFLPMKKVALGIKKLTCFVKSSQIDKNSGSVVSEGDDSCPRSQHFSISAVEGIMTTDTFPKQAFSSFKINGRTVNIWGCAKGSGMIEPNLATMLGFILTDAVIEKSALNKALKNVAEISFNALTVDGDTSTNDTLILLANGSAGNKKISGGGNFNIFCRELEKVCMQLTKMLAADGEGATKLIEINVIGAKTMNDARRIAKTVANSPLVKTAVFGNDANWGRILAAVGRSGVPVVPEKMSISFGNLRVFNAGAPVCFSESKAKKILSGKEVAINIFLNLGSKRAKVLTCDFTEGYIKINASYRS